VVTPDLPSHRTPTAGLAEDADEVRHTIRACAPPVVAVGWSYGGSVISLAAAGERSVSRMIYVSHTPRSAGFPGEDLSWIDADPLVLVHPDGRFVLDNDLWLKDEGDTFPEDVCKHFRDHPRRSVTRATHGAQPQAAWETTPTTVVIGLRRTPRRRGCRRAVGTFASSSRPLTHLQSCGFCRRHVKTDPLAAGWVLINVAT
jgi:pimeloyl-ACP methyl ester carboxylesterase